jgi:hypothetical protein
MTRNLIPGNKAVRVDPDGSLLIGGPASYARLDPTGHLTFLGDARPWDDVLPYAINPGTGLTALSAEQYGTTGFNFYFFDNNTAANESFQALFQIPHRFLENSNAHLHLHVIPSANGSGGNEDVDLELAYQWVNLNAAYSTSANSTDAQTFRVGAADANNHLLWEFDPPLDGSGKTISADLFLRVTRMTKSADRDADNYTGKVYLRFVDLHMQIDAAGSTDETSK